MMAGRYAHAKLKRLHRQLRLLRTRLGRLIRDIRRKIAGRPEIEAAFEWPLARASQIRSQQQRQRGWKLYSFHAPEVECIGKGKASAPYEFGVKASIVTTNARAPGGQFVLHAKALPGNPYDGHTLAAVVEGTERRSIHIASSSPDRTQYCPYDDKLCNAAMRRIHTLAATAHLNLTEPITPPSLAVVGLSRNDVPNGGIGGRPSSRLAK
jgi:hypothetical protein